MSRGTGAILLAAVVVLSAGMAGCLGEDLEPNSRVEDKRSCSNTVREGTLQPGERLTVSETAKVVPASLGVTFDTERFAGEIRLTLEHDGQEIWSDTYQGVGGGDYNHGRTVEETGPYTLTAIAEEGVAQARLVLEIAYGGGSCT